jgi:type VI secretion system protein ImpB
VAKQSSQKLIARNRAPRVQIEYDVEVYGSEKTIQLPFVMGVMADLAGKPETPLPPIADRKFLEIDIDNFDQRLKAMKPRAAFAVPNTLTGEGNLQVDITFESMDDFSPAAIARKVEPLRRLLETRTQLSNLMTYMDGKTGAEDLVGKMLADPTLLQALGSTPNPAAAQEVAPPPAPSQVPAADSALQDLPAENEASSDTGSKENGEDDLDSQLDQLN